MNIHDYFTLVLAIVITVNVLLVMGICIAGLIQAVSFVRSKRKRETRHE